MVAQQVVLVVYRYSIKLCRVLHVPLVSECISSHIKNMLVRGLCALNVRYFDQDKVGYCCLKSALSVLVRCWVTVRVSLHFGIDSTTLWNLVQVCGGMKPMALKVVV